MSKGKTASSQPADDSDAAASASTVTKRTCAICTNKLPSAKVLVLRRCHHILCSECISRYFRLATTDPSLFPAKCCTMPIPLSDAERFLPTDIIKQYKAKTEEHAAEDRTYCHIQKCSTFVPSYSLFDKQAVCPKCMASTCATCKAEWHEGPCVMTDDPLLMQLARVMKWLQCPHCKHLVERTEGCNHMT